MSQSEATPTTRSCTICREVKPLTEFGPNKRMKLGVNSQCRACCRAAQAARRDPEKNRADAARWRAENPEKAKASRAASRLRHIEKVRARNRARYQANKEAMLEYQREYRAPDLMSKSIDHIIPLARGGTHTQDNVQWAHLGCNFVKGARVDLPEEGAA